MTATLENLLRWLDEKEARIVRLETEIRALHLRLDRQSSALLNQTYRLEALEETLPLPEPEEGDAEADRQELLAIYRQQQGYR